MKRLLFLGALLLPSLALAQATPVTISGQPIAVTTSGAADTTGPTTTISGNSQCAVVLLTGQPAPGVHIAAGTLATTLTASLSDNATPATSDGNGNNCPGGKTCSCTGGTYPTTAKFSDASGNQQSSLTLTNPNTEAQWGITTISGNKCARVCSASSGTTGSAVLFLQATVASSPPPAAGADVTDRAARLVGVTYGSQGQQLQQTATNFNLRSELAVGATLIDPRAIRALTSSDTVTANAGTGTFAVSAASLPLPTGAATAALQTSLNSLLPTTLDGSGFLKTHEQGTATIAGTVTANAGSGTMAVSAAALPLPTGAAADTSVNGLLLTQGSTTSGQKGPLHQGAVTTSPPTYTTAQTAPISLQTDGSQRVALTNTPTVTANAGSGTFAVSAAALPLPTGAAQDSSVTGLQVSQGSTTSGQKGSLQLGAVATSAPTLTNGQSSALSLDTTGSLRVNVTTGGGSNASVGATGSAVPSSATLVGGSKSGNTAALVLDASGNLNVNVAAGGASGGTSSTFGSAFPGTGTAVGAKDSTGANLAALNLDASGFLKVNVAAGGGSGGTSSTFGAASPGTGTAAGGFATTAAPTYTTGNMGALSLTTAGGLREDLTTIAGTAADTNSGTKSAGTLRVVLATDQPALTNKLLVTPDSVALPANQSVNESQINGVTPLMGNGVTGTGSQRVTIASDNTAFAVNATVTQATGSNLHAQLDSGSTTAVTQATAANLNAQVQGPAASGASKSGNPVQTGAVFNTTQPTVTTGQAVENQATSRGAQIVATGADTFNVTVTSAPTTAVTIGSLPALTTGSATIGAVTGPSAAPLALDATLTGGSLKAKVTGNAGAAMDAAGQNAASPANELLIAGQFNTSPATITSGNVSPLQVDNAGNLNVNIKAGASSGAVAQGSTTSGQTGSLVQAAVTTGAPTYTTAQTSPLSQDTAGNLRTSVNNTVNMQGLGSLGTPSGGPLTVQGGTGMTPLSVQTAGSTVLAANAADSAALAASLSTACTTATACLNTASIQWAVNGAQSSEVVIISSGSPLGFTSQVADASYDTGTTYQLAKCTLVRSDATGTGTVKTALVNADLTSTPSSWQIFCPGSPSNVRFRVAGTPTSGSFSVAGRAVFAPGPAPTQGAAIALGAPLNAAGSNIGQTMMAVDSTTPTTGRMFRADANGLLVSQGTAANFNATAVITDGTNTPKVQPATTSAALADKALTVSQSPNPSPECTSFIAINQTTGTTVITGTASQKIYICSIALVSATAQSVSVIEGTGTVCASGTPIGVLGGTTASMAFGANGGLSMATSRPFFKGRTAADNICIVQSGAGNVSGVITYVSAP